jgi:LPXTG-site transpeptidase (sortase) family protein
MFLRYHKDMSFIATWKRRREKKYKILYKRGPSTLALVFAGMALALWGIFAVLSSYPVGLYLYYTVVPKTTILLGKALHETTISSAAAIERESGTVNLEPTTMVEVAKDLSLPEGHYLSIPKIGVDTILWEAPSDSYEQVLRKGVWRVPEFADPTLVGQGRPMILAAHRFGYLDWTQAYRLKNSFYDLPKLKNGDMVEIVWNQHRYDYQIQKVEEGTDISDYSSDLIMYTCKFLVSPVRIFVYAKKI